MDLFSANLYDVNLYDIQNCQERTLDFIEQEICLEAG